MPLAVRIASPIPLILPVSIRSGLLLFRFPHFCVNPSINIGICNSTPYNNQNGVVTNRKNGNRKSPINMKRQREQIGIGSPLTCKHLSAFLWHGTLRNHA